MTTTKNIKINLLEVLLLQRFPYGQDSTFFYFGRDEFGKTNIGDIVEVPFRKSFKKGVVVKNRIISVPYFVSQEWKINLFYLDRKKNYFFATLPNKTIKIKSINKIIEKGFFPEKLILHSKLISQKYHVSWNHFAKFVAENAKAGKHAKISYLNLMGKLRKMVDKRDSFKKQLPSSLCETVLSKKNFFYLFLSYKQSSQLGSIIQKTLENKQQILVLVPEKSQLLPICAKYSFFSEKTSCSSPIILSKLLSKSAYKDSWQLTRSLTPAIFIGTRSSIFAPYKKLGLIILEDGHDANYKQWDMTPRYDVRSVLPVIYPGVLKIYLSLTPRFEDFYNSPFYLSKGLIKKFSFQSLRFSEPQLETENNFEEPASLLTKIKVPSEEKKCELSIINLKIELKINNKSLVFSKYLKKSLFKALNDNQWALIVSNHKGVSSSMVCKDCGFSPECPNCQKPLYQSRNLFLSCYFCGFEEKSPNICPKCRGFNFYFPGVGFEKIKEELIEMKKEIKFTLIVPPDPKLGFNKYFEFWEKLNSFKNKPCVLLGYSGIIPIARLFKSRIAVSSLISLDGLLHNPDYKSEEKAASRFYNLISVAPKIIFQTYNPKHPFFHKILNNSYSSFFHSWSRERIRFNYPPFTDLVKLEIVGKNQKETEIKAKKISNSLKNKSGVLESILISADSFFKRGFFHYIILLKIKKGSSLDTILGSLPLETKIDIGPESL